MSIFSRLFSLDLRSLALFRIALGVILLLDLVSRAFDLRAHYTDAGVLPRRVFFADYRADELWSLHLATGSVGGELALFLVTAAVAVLLILGVRARLTCFVALVLTLSLQDRNPVVFYGFDLLLRVALLWGCFLPLGARFSLTPSPRPSDACFSAGTLAFTLQMVIIYVFSALQKSEDSTWLDLSAMFYAVTADTHATSVARALVPHTSVLRALSAVVLGVEMFGPLLLLVPISNPVARDRVRLVAVALFAGFHLFTAVLFTLGLFPLMGIVVWLAFLPASAWRRLPSTSPAPLVVEVRRVEAGGVGALLAVILAFNIETVADVSVLSPNVRSAARVLHLEQTWNMFSRPIADGWFVAEAVLADDTRVDILTRGQPVTFAKPALVSSTFPSMRWRKYMTMLIRPAGQRARAPLLRYLCENWDGAAAVNLWFVREVEHEDGAAASTDREMLGSRSCR